MPTPASLAVVVAAYNEEAALPALHARLRAVLDGLALEARVLYVDDGSRDGTWATMRHLAAGDARVVLLRLSGNLGKVLGVPGGLGRADGDAVGGVDAVGLVPVAPAVPPTRIM